MAPDVQFLTVAHPLLEQMDLGLETAALAEIFLKMRKELVFRRVFVGF
jgi:hypothetical protein